MHYELNLFDFEHSNKIVQLEQELISFENNINHLQMNECIQFQQCKITRHKFYEVEIDSTYHEIFYTYEDLLSFLKQINFL